MESKSVAAGQGIEWFKCGWNLFKQDYGTWFVMILIFFGIAIVLNFIPFVGALALAIISPVLMGGIMYAAAQMNSGNSIEIGQLFQGFKDKERMNKLLILGVLSIIAQLILMFISFLLIGGNTMMSVGESGEFDPEAMMTAGMSISMLLIMFVGLIIAMAFLYSAPLVMLDKVAPVDALKTSFAACLHNILPLLLFGIIYLVLAIIAIIPLGLGLLLLIPVGVLAMYCSYRSIFH
jgi:uncharacterized membrane protein